MLSLVAYGNSDSEDENSLNKSEDNDSENNKNNGAVEVITKADESDITTNIFEALPKPQIGAHDVIVEEDDEYLKRKEISTEKPKKQPIKISVPSLAEFDSDDDETPSKKPKISSKSCGLFALLPAPKSTTATTKRFVPNAVKKNINKKIKPPKKVVPVIVKSKGEKKSENVDSENDDDDDMKNLPDTFDDEIWQKVCGRKQRRVQIPILEKSVENKITIQPNPEVKKPYEGLDNEAFKELIGATSKRKVEDIDIVEIAEDEMLSDKKIWMTKSLTDPEMAPKYVIKDPVNDTCKRKHHITYLAQQAKANEQELQNQWAQSRFTRQKTQAKYGF